MLSGGLLAPCHAEDLHVHCRLIIGEAPPASRAYLSVEKCDFQPMLGPPGLSGRVRPSVHPFRLSARRGAG